MLAILKALISNYIASGFASAGMEQTTFSSSPTLFFNVSLDMLAQKIRNVEDRMNEHNWALISIVTGDFYECGNPALAQYTYTILRRENSL